MTNVFDAGKKTIEDIVTLKGRVSFDDYHRHSVSAALVSLSVMAGGLTYALVQTEPVYSGDYALKVISIGLSSMLSIGCLAGAYYNSKK